MARTAIDWAREELAARVAAIEATADLVAPGDLAREIDRVRRAAQDNGLVAAVTVAQRLGQVLGQGERGPLVHRWLTLLGDALCCDDVRAAETLVAAAAVRFAG